MRIVISRAPVLLFLFSDMFPDSIGGQEGPPPSAWESLSYDDWFSTETLGPDGAIHRSVVVASTQTFPHGCGGGHWEADYDLWYRSEAGESARLATFGGACWYGANCQQQCSYVEPAERANHSISVNARGDILIGLTTETEMPQRFETAIVAL